MGEDGQHTMYIDLVASAFAKNSTSSEVFPVGPDIRGVFQQVRLNKDGA